MSRKKRTAGRRTGSARRAPRRKRKKPDWVRLSNDALLELRFCDLGVRIEGTWLEEVVAQLLEELAGRGLRFRPHCWLSNEWFSPDGIPGIAIPFYLAHPRLMRLERHMMLEVEGGTREECLKILRHEAGHAVDAAYRVRRKRRWQQTFGKASAPYPETYRPKPYSRDFVLHLDWWYAQSHPLEDFAETFAVWLRPGSRWRTRYRGWRALCKLEYVDELMQELAGKTPPVRSKRVVDPVRTLRRTLRSHYETRQAHYGVDRAQLFDRDLLRLFRTGAGGSRNGRSAVGFLRRERRALRERVAQWTQQHPYMVDQFLNEMIGRCRALKLELCRPEPETRLDTALLLTVQVMAYLQRGGHPIAL